MEIRIDIVEDNKVIKENLIKYIEYQNDMTVHLVSGTVEDYLLQQRHQLSGSDVVLLDIGLPGMSGLEGIPKIKELNPEIDIIMLTTYEEEQVVVKALCSGACSYISKKTSLLGIVEAIRIVKAGGSYMSPSIAREIVTYLMGGMVSRATMLTDRQREILKLLAEGKKYSDIAEHLYLSVETVKSHIKKLYQTLHVNGKSEAIAKYLKGEIK